MVDSDTELDEQLAAYKEALSELTPPDELRQKILAAANPVQNKSALSNATLQRSFPIFAWGSIAASLGIITLSILFTTQQKTPAIEEHITDTPMLTGNHVRYPVRVHSLARGAEWRYLPSHIVKDQRGRTRMIVVKSVRRNL